MDQGVKYVVSLQDVNVVSGLRTMESSAVSTEKSIAELNATLREVGTALGIGYGLRELVNFGKDAVQGAADYETAVKRIKFASENLAEGQRNIAFIAAEADKFKIPLQSATDAYGKFLAMLSGSGIQSEQVRKLHDELLLIGKVKGLGDGQMDAAVMNLGKMLESGSLDARHFRPLEQQLSGIGAFVARELGISVHQLAILRNKGKMTQIDPKVLLAAIEKQAASLKQFLPESTSTIQSQINDLDNAWLKFKNDLVYDNIGELRSLFETLKDGIAWLEKHKNELKYVAEGLLTIGKIWLEYKIAIGATNLVMNTYKGYMAGYLAETSSVVSSTEARTLAMNELALSMERVAMATEAMAMTTVPDYATLAAAGGAARKIGAVEGAAGAGMISGSQAVTIVGLTVGAIELFRTVFADHRPGYQYDPGISKEANAELKKTYDEIRKGQDAGEPWHAAYWRSGSAAKDIKQATDTLSGTALMAANASRYLSGASAEHVSGARMPNIDFAKMGAGINAPTPTPKPEKGGGGTSHITPPTDRVTGQRIVTYNITIKEINGIKENKVEAGGKMDTKSVAEELRDIINSVVNDSQIGGDR